MENEYKWISKLISRKGTQGINSQIFLQKKDKKLNS